jgi:hypothetical protein
MSCPEGRNIYHRRITQDQISVEKTEKATADAGNENGGGGEATLMVNWFLVG